MSPRATRVMRYMLLAVGCLGAVVLFMLVAASANDSRFAQQLNVLKPVSRAVFRFDSRNVFPWGATSRSWNA